jgi:hypothetical protein
MTPQYLYQVASVGLHIRRRLQTAQGPQHPCLPSSYASARHHRYPPPEQPSAYGTYARPLPKYMEKVSYSRKPLHSSDCAFGACTTVANPSKYHQSFPPSTPSISSQHTGAYSYCSSHVPILTSVHNVRPPSGLSYLIACE